MKRFFLNIFLFALAATAMAEGNTWLMLQMSNGSRMSYIIPGKMRISFNDNDLLLTSSRLTTSFARSTVTRYSFFCEGNIIDGIEETTVDDVRITYVTRDLVEISGLPSGQHIKVYASNGTEQQPHISQSADKARIDLSTLGSGVFIVTLPNSAIPSLKIIH